MISGIAQAITDHRINGFRGAPQVSYLPPYISSNTVSINVSTIKPTNPKLVKIKSIKIPIIVSPNTDAIGLPLLMHQQCY